MEIQQSFFEDSVEIRLLSDQTENIEYVARQILSIFGGHAYASQIKKNREGDGYRQYITVEIRERPATAMKEGSQ